MTPKKMLVITPDQVRIGPGWEGSVMAEILGLEKELGLVASRLALRMTPAEARKIAKILNSKADEVEALQNPN